MVKVILMVMLTFCYDVDNASDVGANLYNKTLLPHPSISKMSDCRGWPKTESWKYIYWFHTNTWKGHSKQSAEKYLCLIIAKRICPSCNLYFCIDHQDLESLSLLTNSRLSDPILPKILWSSTLSETHCTPLLWNYPLCANTKYEKTEIQEINPFKSSTFDWTEYTGGAWTENIKCKYGEMHMVVVNIEDFCAMRKSTKWCTIHSVLCKFTWAESRSEVMWGTGQDRTSLLPPIVVPRNWIPSQPFQPLVFQDPSESHWRDCPSWVNKFCSQNSVANENNRYVGPNPKVGL